MECILCLERIKTKICNLNLSESSHAVEMIKTHFWIEPDPQKQQMLCQTCWKSLSSFHDFYMSIKKCHDILKDTTMPKKRRGRPPKLKNTNSENEVNGDGLLETHLSELVMVMSEDTLSEIKSELYEVTEYKIASRASTPELFIKNEAKLEINSEEEISIRNEPIQDDDTDEMEPIEIINVHEDMEINSVAEIPISETISNDMDPIETASKIIPTVIKKKPTSALKPYPKKIDEFIATNFIMSCAVCSVTVDTFAGLKSHYRVEHKMRGYVLCCGKKLLKRCVLVDHINFHLNPKFFQCKRCEKVLCDRRSLEKHMDCHDDKKDRVYQCDSCKKSFFKRCVFEKHLLLHLPEEQKTVPCTKCEKKFATKTIMNEHFRLVHLNSYAKVCELCGKFIRGGMAMERHLLEHAGVQPTMVQCELCSISLTNKYGLARHMKTSHTEEFLKPQTCTICKKVSPSMSAHNRHVKYMHRMSFKHSCPMCKKSFRRGTDLKEHLTTHTGEVLYTCPHCPKTFNSNANMYAHRKRSHPVEWEATRRSRYMVKESAPKMASVMALARAAAPPPTATTKTKEE